MEEKKEIKSRKQRHKDFNPRKWARKWLKDGGGLSITTASHEADPFWSNWEFAIKCQNIGCEATTGGAWLKPDGKWYCAYCYQKVPGINLMVQNRNIKEPEILVKNYKWILFKEKVSSNLRRFYERFKKN